MTSSMKLTPSRSLIPDMDHHVKRMLKLIEEDADTFTKKVETYYQKRPELINLVEDVYRMYRSLAERHDHVTSELRKTMPSDLQSQCSGITDLGSEPPSTMPSPGPSRRQSGHRAPGFDFFLGNHAGIGADVYGKEGDESSTLEFESESDDSSVNYYSSMQSNDDEQALRRKIIEVESELREVKERSAGVENYDRIARYEHQLRIAKDKIQQSDEEIRRLNFELRRYKDADYNLVDQTAAEVQESGNGEVLESECKILTLWEEHRITREKLRASEQEIARLRQELTSKGFPVQNLQDQLKIMQKELSALKDKLDDEKDESAKLHEIIARYKADVAERDQEISGLREAFANVKEVDLRLRFLEEEMKRVEAEKAEMEETYALQMEQLKAEIAYKSGYIEELQVKHEMLMNEKDDRIDQMSSHLHQMQVEQVDLIAARKLAEELRSKIKELEREVEKKQQIIVQGAEEKREAIRQLCFSLEHYRNGYHRLREVVTGQKAMASS
ncbi:protein NETWORKED 4A-like [Salvia miltiorrhiza]|uniref:protein NETWORKED 4A-like n=1 Tax=Salvia miltiorrhiza TaxID=226208 RepID=UPI0025AC0B43|nr:protein NETWORKED 4A-like [Salvia miltiorrhiza]